MMTALIVSGILTMGQAPLASQEVMLIPHSGDKVICVAETDAKGFFELKADSTGDSSAFFLFSNVISEKCMVSVWKEVKFPVKGMQNINVDTLSGSFVKLKCDLKTKKDFPVEFVFHCFPLHIDELPENLQKFSHLELNNAPRLDYQVNVNPKHFEIWIQKGDYIINGDYQPLNPDVDVTSRSYITTSILADGTKKLKGDRKKGFKLRPGNDLKLSFLVREKRK